ncbi:MAG: ABC transporter substrate-binding protein [Microbacteriaceae bacterium]
MRGKVVSAFKTAFVLSAVTGLAVGCATSGNETPTTTEPGAVETIKIGAILPLTGATAQNGNNSLRGIELAIEQINEAGGIKSMGGAKFELSSADATSDAATAANAATEFLSKGDKPLAIVGAYASGLTTTVARVTERAKIPLLSTSFSDELTQQGYKYFFQLPAPASKMGTAQMKYAIEIADAAGKKIDKVAIVYANNAYGESQGVALKAQAEAAGKQVVLYEGYAPTIVDAGPIVQKITSSGADAVFSIAYVSDGVLLMRALKQSGSTIPIFGGTGGYITPDFVKALGAGVDGLFSVTTSNPDGYGDIGAAYLKKYGEFMPQEAHDNAAAVYVIAEALEMKPTTDPEVLKETLHSNVFSMGAAGQMPNGKVEFDETGANHFGSPLMVQWQNQNLVGVWPKDIVKGAPVWDAK